MRIKLLLLIYILPIAPAKVAIGQTGVDLRPYEPYFMPTDSLMEWGLGAIQAGDADAAFFWLSYVPAHDRRYAEALMAVADLYTQLQQPDSAAYFLKKVLAVNSEFGHDAGVKLAQAYENMGQRELAAATYRAGLKRYALSYPIAYLLGVLYSDMDKPDSALCYLRKCVEIYPFYHFAHLAIGEVCLAQGRVVEAAMALCVGVTMEPDRQESLGALLALEEATLAFSLGKAVWHDTLGRKTSLPWLLPGAASLPLAPSPRLRYPTQLQPMILMDWIITNLPLLQGLPTNPELELYALFYHEVEVYGKTELFLHQLYQSVENRAIKEYMLGHGPEYEAFLNDGTAFWQTHFMRAHLQLPDTCISLPAWFDEEGFPVGAGLVYGDAQAGLWFYSYANFEPRAYGAFDRFGVKTGRWTYFDSSGVMQSQETFFGGSLESATVEYYPNGKFRARYNAHQDRVQGPVQVYGPTGRLLMESEHRDNRRNGTSTTFHPDGSVRMVATYKEDEPVGKVLRYYPNHALESEFFYAEGLPHGPIKLYHFNGQPQTTGYYIQGKKAGLWQTYDKLGFLEEEMEYKNDEPHGFHRIYWPNGKAKRDARYENGLQSGLTIEFDSVGQTTARFQFQAGGLVSYVFYGENGQTLHHGSGGTGTFHYKRVARNGVIVEEGDQMAFNRQGVWTTRYLNGAVHELVPHKQGEISGLVRRFYPDGSPLEGAHYAHDLPNGLRYRQHQNGQLALAENLANGAKNGYSFRFYSNGIRQSEGCYKNDTLWGKQHYFLVSGQPFRSEWHADTGLTYILYRVGDPFLRDTIRPALQRVPYVHRHANGSPFIFGILDNNTITDTLKYYTKESHFSGYETYHFNERDGGFQFFLPGSQQLLSAGGYVYGERHGEWRWLNEDGAPTKIENYNVGIKVGVWHDFNADGKLMSSSSYQNNLLHGWQYYFSPSGDTLLRLYYALGQLVHPLLAPFAYANADSFSMGSGILICHDRAGKITARAQFINSEMHGKQSFYHPNSGNHPQPAYVLNYNFGNPHGQQQWFYANGNLQQIAIYEYGERTGQWRYFSAAGNLTKSESYMCGFQHGPTEIYRAEPGKVYKTIHYMQNFPISVVGH